MVPSETFATFLVCTENLTATANIKENHVIVDAFSLMNKVSVKR
jgi:hypothetical protein